MVCPVVGQLSWAVRPVLLWAASLGGAAPRGFAASSELDMMGILRAPSASVSLCGTCEGRGAVPGVRWVNLAVTDGYSPGEVAEQMRESEVQTDAARELG